MVQAHQTAHKACTEGTALEVMKQLGIDQVKLYVSHTDLAMTHEQIKRPSPHLHFSYTYLEESILVSSKIRQNEKKIPNIIIAL